MPAFLPAAPLISQELLNPIIPHFALLLKVVLMCPKGFAPWWWGRKTQPLLYPRQHCCHLLRRNTPRPLGHIQQSNQIWPDCAADTSSRPVLMQDFFFFLMGEIERYSICRQTCNPEGVELYNAYIHQLFRLLLGGNCASKLARTAGEFTFLLLKKVNNRLFHQL